MVDEELALRGNKSGYADLEEQSFLGGSPHLRHPGLKSLYERLVDSVTAAVDRPVQDLSVLELGAGDGLASVPWFNRRVQLTAVDCSNVMLGRLQTRAEHVGLKVTTVEADAGAYLANTDRQFDVICFVSMLHHVPDYIALLGLALQRTRPGGCFLTFQDPLRYDTMRRVDLAASRFSYFAWRSTQGNLRQGLKTRFRRLRGLYSPSEASADFGEYHVVRNGVDSSRIIDTLASSFRDIRLMTYWATQGTPLQALGDRLGLRTHFSVLASKRLTNLA
jgi:SAM-dependent methyltransferase